LFNNDRILIEALFCTNISGYATLWIKYTAATLQKGQLGPVAAGRRSGSQIMFATIAFANGLNVKPFAHTLPQGGHESIVSLNWLVYICLNLPLVANILLHHG